MKTLILVILTSLAFLGLLGLVGTIDRQSEELTILKQLYNAQQYMLKSNFSEHELDSMYLECNYHYLDSYYEKNYK